MRNNLKVVSEKYFQFSKNSTVKLSESKRTRKKNEDS